MGIRAWVLRQAMGRLRITDDIVRHLTTFQRLGETVEVQLPTELLPVGARTLFRAVRTRGAAQLGVDWVWRRRVHGRRAPRLGGRGLPVIGPQRAGPGRGHRRAAVAGPLHDAPGRVGRRGFGRAERPDPCRRPVVRAHHERGQPVLSWELDRRPDLAVPVPISAPWLDRLWSSAEASGEVRFGRAGDDASVGGPRLGSP